MCVLGWCVYVCVYTHIYIFMYSYVDFEKNSFVFFQRETVVSEGGCSSKKRSLMLFKKSHTFGGFFFTNDMTLY